MDGIMLMNKSPTMMCLTKKQYIKILDCRWSDYSLQGAYIFILSHFPVKAISIEQHSTARLNNSVSVF